MISAHHFTSVVYYFNFLLFSLEKHTEMMCTGGGGAEGWGSKKHSVEEIRVLLQCNLHLLFIYHIFKWRRSCCAVVRIQWPQLINYPLSGLIRPNITSRRVEELYCNYFCAVGVEGRGCVCGGGIRPPSSSDSNLREKEKKRRRRRKKEEQPWDKYQAAAATQLKLD